MSAIAWVAILTVALVTAERVRFSRAASWTMQDPEQSKPKQESGPLSPEQVRVQEHYWSKRAGNLQSNSNVPWTAPTTLSRGPSWSWSNPLDEQVRHSPLIDRNMDIYIATGTRIRKFSKQGALLWTADSLAAVDDDAEMSTCPVLYGDAILALLHSKKSPRTIIYSLRLDTGAVNWRRERASDIGTDGNALLAMNDSLVFGANDASNKDGPSNVVAVSTLDGQDLWEFKIGAVVWNFVPASPGDGTLLFSTSCGVPHKLDAGGRLLWKGAGSGKSGMCSAGGGALSPDGLVFYTSWSDLVPGTNFQAVSVLDGSVLWTKTVYFGDFPSSAQYPAVGRLGPDGPLAVVGSVGDQPFMAGQDPRGDNRTLVNAVVALHAETGEILWLSEEAPWPHSVAAGDELDRVVKRAEQNPRLSPACWPDAQGIPLIAGDGTVYASSSHSGDLRSIKHHNVEGVVDASHVQVSTFHPGMGFLNSPSIAPGLLVAAPCWGPTYVFLEEDAESGGADGGAEGGGSAV